MKPPPPLVLGIETSCDDTACALVDGDGRVLASVVSSQLGVPLAYAGDNAAMIAQSALLRHRRGVQDDPRQADVASRLPF